MNGEAIFNTSGYPFGIHLGCTTPHELVGEQAAAYTMVAHTKSSSEPGIYAMQGISAEDAEAWCTSNQTCAGFNYFSVDDTGNQCGKQGAGGLGWLGCANFKKAGVSSRHVPHPSTATAGQCTACVVQLTPSLMSSLKYGGRPE